MVASTSRRPGGVTIESRPSHHRDPPRNQGPDFYYPEDPPSAESESSFGDAQQYPSSSSTDSFCAQHAQPHALRSGEWQDEYATEQHHYSHRGDATAPYDAECYDSAANGRQSHIADDIPYYCQEHSTSGPPDDDYTLSGRPQRAGWADQGHSGYASTATWDDDVDSLAQALGEVDVSPYSDDRWQTWPQGVHDQDSPYTYPSYAARPSNNTRKVHSGRRSNERHGGSAPSRRAASQEVELSGDVLVITLKSGTGPGVNARARDDPVNGMGHLVSLNMIRKLGLDKRDLKGEPQKCYPVGRAGNNPLMTLGVVELHYRRASDKYYTTALFHVVKIVLVDCDVLLATGNSTGNSVIAFVGAKNPITPGKSSLPSPIR